MELAYAAAALLAAGAAAGGAWWGLLRRPLPQVAGALAVPGLRRPVQVLRDRLGVPHIHAETPLDAFLAQGYVHAQERLWQLELYRRTAAGRLSAVMGARTLPVDRFFRRLGLYRTAAAEWHRLDRDTRAVAEAYVHGINAALAAARGRLPLEFRLLRFRPEPWTAVDVLAQGRLLAFGLAMNWGAEFYRGRLLARFGPELVARVEGPDLAAMPHVVPPGAEQAYERLEELYRAALPFLGAGASNGWAVTGARSTTGGALVANDIHLGLEMPSGWFLSSLNAPGLAVAGAGRPGTPGVAIGRTPGAAWGFTVAPADQADLYLERCHPQDPDRYEFRGEWLQADVAEEVIEVRGGRPVTERVRSTRHGPVLAAAEPGGLAVALRWPGLDPEPANLPMLLAANRAQDLDSLRAAVRAMRAPALNCLMGGADGRVGYQLCGALPDRAPGSGLVPLPGWSGEHEWPGFIPPGRLAAVADPPQGFVGSANNPTGVPGHHVVWETNSGARAERIDALLGGGGPVAPEFCRQMQMDTAVVPAQRFARHLLALPPAHLAVLPPAALAALRDWDGRADAGSVGYAVCQAAFLAALERVLGHWLGLRSGHWPEPAWDSLAGLPSATSYLDRLLRELEWRDAGFLAAVGAQVPAGEGDPWERLLAGALAGAAGRLRELCGPDPAGWTWGRVHPVRLQHPLGKLPLLGRLLNPPARPADGDQYSLLVLTNRADRPGANSFGAAYRQVCDLADPHRLQVMLAPGQSGLPGSPHYQDLLAPWLRGELHTITLDRAEAEQAAVHRLALRPASGPTSPHRSS